MIRRGTWAVLAVFVAVLGLGFLLRERPEETGISTAPSASMPPLFGTALPSITRIQVEGSTGELVEFSRNAEGTWVLVAPEAAPADQAAAEAAATQLGALRVLANVRLAPTIVGLDRPLYVITLETKGSQVHVLKVGSMTPINDGYYVVLDDGPQRVVDRFGMEELLGLIERPPYLETPTPEDDRSTSTLPSATGGIEGAAASETPPATPSPSG